MTVKTTRKTWDPYSSHCQPARPGRPFARTPMHACTSAGAHTPQATRSYTPFAEGSLSQAHAIQGQVHHIQSPRRNQASRAQRHSGAGLGQMWAGHGADVGRFWDAHAPPNQSGVSQTRHGRASSVGLREPCVGAAAVHAPCFSSNRNVDERCSDMSATTLRRCLVCAVCLRRRCCCVVCLHVCAVC